MKVLFLSIGRIGNLNERGIYTDLLRKFRDEGHEVYVVSPIERRENKQTEFVKEGDITFLRVKIGNITKVNVIEKGISTLTIERKFLFAIKNQLNSIRFDLVIYSTPPITFEKVIKYIKDRDNARSYLLLKDIFPQNAVDLKMLHKVNPIYWYFRYKEKRLYKTSDYIGCMSPANVEYVKKNNSYLDNRKLEVCPNSIEPLILKKNSDEIYRLRKKYDIPLDKMICVYGGNLGKPQGLSFLMKCLIENEKNDKIHFVIAGSGTEYQKLKRFFKERNLKNCQLLYRLPKDDYELLVNSSDVGLIFLDYKFTIPNFPSRLLSYMQASLPVLAATDKNTDLKDIIEQGGFGKWSYSNDVESFIQVLNKFTDEMERKIMGEKSLKYLEEHYTVNESYRIIMRHFRTTKKEKVNV